MDELMQAARMFCVPFYCEPQRAYHTLRHVESMLDALDDRGVLTYPLALAVWGHDLIYDPKQHDNEAQSARQFGDWLEGQGAEQELVAEVRRLILETRHTEPPTDRTAALLIDADLSIFGADDDSFWAYEQAIRQEYSFVPWALYREGRMTVLHEFLKREQIYTTPEFAGLEAGARGHLGAAVAMLLTQVFDTILSVPPVIGICGLCDQEKELVNSHIIPRNIVKWLKSNPERTYLRNPLTPNLRVPDGPKRPLLCFNCDNNILGPSEKYFKESVFLKYHECKSLLVEYSEAMYHFATALAFKIILLEEHDEEIREGIDYNKLSIFKNILKQQLLSGVQNTYDVQNYVLLTDNFENYKQIIDNGDEICIIHHSLSSSMHHIFLRSIDCFVFEGNETQIACTILPGFIFYTVLDSNIYNGRLGSKIYRAGGKIGFSPGSLIHHDFYGMHEEHAEMNSKIEISDRQLEKIAKKINRLK